MDNIKEELLKCCELTYFDEPMFRHTSFEIGGKAKYFVVPKNFKELISLINLIKSNNIEYFILGNGSNLLVSDKGFEGLIISTKELKGIELANEDTLLIGSGAKMRDISNFALENELTGFEFASGIPGSIGGAVCMNAGAYDGEIKDVLESIIAVDEKAEIYVISKEELNLDYRQSNIKEKNLIVFSVKLKLKKGKYEEIKAKIDDLDYKRSSKQPLEYPSSGSTFKRPKGYFAGKLISDAGLQGFNIGGAEVSTKHAGFIINKDNASASSVHKLIKHIISTVDKKFSVKLEPEVKFLGEFDD